MGIFGSVFGLILLVVALLSGVVSVLRELQMMYLPAKAETSKVFWGWFRIVVFVALVLLWVDEHSKVVQFSPSVSFKFVNTNGYIIPPDPRLGDGHNWAVLVELRTARLDGARLALYSASYRRDASQQFKQIDSVHAWIARYGWQGTYDPTDLFDSEHYVLFLCSPDGTHLSLLTSAKEPELSQMQNMLPGEYALELVATGKNLVKPAKVIATVKWTGTMNGGFDMSINPE